MPTTPNGLRYPAASDSPNGPLQVGNLAIDVDAQLTALIRGYVSATRRLPITVTTKVNPDAALTGVIAVPAAQVATRVVFTAMGRSGFAAAARQIAWDWDSTPGTATLVVKDSPADRIDVAATDWGTVVSTLSMDMPAGVAASARLMLRANGDAYNRGSVVWHRSPVI